MGVHEQVNVKCVYLFMCERVPVLVILCLCLHAGKRDRRLSMSMDVAQVELGLQRRSCNNSGESPSSTSCSGVGAAGCEALACW